MSYLHLTFFERVCNLHRTYLQRVFIYFDMPNVLDVFQTSAELTERAVNVEQAYDDVLPALSSNFVYKRGFT